MSAPEVYLITAIEADGSRRTWVGPKPVHVYTQISIDYMHAHVELHDPHRTSTTRYEVKPLHTLPDCPTKDKQLTQ
jgi:hypothetical protein